MNKLELKSLICWYVMVFRSRLTNYKKTRNKQKLTCYIFANEQDMKEYCRSINLECTKYWYKDYFLINEEEYVNLGATRITDVVLVSSNVSNIVKIICNAAKEREQIGFKCLI